MINLKKKSLYLSYFLSGLLCVLLTSCGTYRYIYYDLDEAPKIDNITLVSLTYQNNTGVNNKVYYPYSDFMLEPFLTGLLDEFNSNTNAVKLTLLPSSTISQITPMLMNHHRPVFLHSNSLIIEGLPIWKKIRPYHKVIKASYYLTLNLTFSSDDQSVTGYFKLRGTNEQGRVIWREQILHQSPYIENDVDSPYRSTSDSLTYPPADETSNHYLERKKAFLRLGETVAESLKETLAHFKRL